MLTLLHLMLLLAFATASPAFAQPQNSGGSSVPAQAAAAGYNTKTFETTVFGANNVDVGSTNRTGFQWYLIKRAGCRTCASPKWAEINGAFGADGSVTTRGAASNASIATGNPMPESPGYVGTAFGGGVYVEAEIAFCMPCIKVQSGGWPSFWSSSAEMQWFGAGDPRVDWPGQPKGYVHQVELDMFEALMMPKDNDRYGTALHDWYGIYQKTCPGRGFCVVHSNAEDHGNVVITPPGTDWAQTTPYNRIGMLWVPATGTTPGSITFWLNDAQVARTVSWKKCPASGFDPPPAAPYTFCRIDQQHLMLEFGASGSTPITVHRVTVWQKDAGANMHN